MYHCGGGGGSGGSAMLPPLSRSFLSEIFREKATLPYKRLGSSHSDMQKKPCGLMLTWEYAHAALVERAQDSEISTHFLPPV